MACMHMWKEKCDWCHKQPISHALELRQILPQRHCGLALTKCMKRQSMGNELFFGMKEL